MFKYHNSCLEVVWRAAQGCLEWAEARRYCGHVFAGLRHLHAHDVCHRDLCLANLLLSFRDNIVQIADLGLAACAASFTLERNVAQLAARSRSSFSHRGAEGPALLTHPQLSVDLWSSGTVVAALHVGRQLFEGHDELTQLQAVIDLLGPPLDVWPGCVELDLWCEYEGSFANRQPEMPPMKSWRRAKSSALCPRATRPSTSSCACWCGTRALE